MLPGRPQSALVLGGLTEWEDNIAALGIPIDTKQPDVVIAPANHAEPAIALSPPYLVLLGDERRRLRGRGYVAQSVLPLPSPHDAELLVPVGDPIALRYVFTAWRQPAGLRQHARRGAVLGLARTSFITRARPCYTIAARTEGPPFVIAAASQIGLPAKSHWVFTSPGLDSLSRAAFIVFPDGAQTPQWVVKLARLSQASEAFDLDQRGLALAVAAGPIVAEHAPRLLGRFVAAGHHASVESAAVGEQLSVLLMRRRDRALPLVRAVADWLIEVATATCSEPTGARDELQRIRSDVAPEWDVPGDAITELPALPTVLGHHDLGPWNVIARGSDFTVLDWEGATTTALPLWDLVYFLVHALALVEGAAGPDAVADKMMQLLRGEARFSPLLFETLRRAARALDLDNEVIGPLVSMCWMHHGLSHVDRRRALNEYGGTMTLLPPAGRLARQWLDDPALGFGWRAFAHADTR